MPTPNRAYEQMDRALTSLEVFLDQGGNYRDWIDLYAQQQRLEKLFKKEAPRPWWRRLMFWKG